ncbi:hypothetical protein [Arthrobacter sp. ISL-5]|uniref:hypothetical protein n=1 Tax=Arthrobacter sp. ISL-5 TaxID=2819111 RepID=UPI001BEB31F3|nr:hypothetical protein [Arthrobacter sp. ISL-5]MBT2554768.1 hypothetical protein [Arthrobacter sp. ISL-5]
MEDPTTIALNLTFFGTLGVAFVMFIGMFILVVITLVIAGVGRLAALILMALFGRFPGNDTIEVVRLPVGTQASPGAAPDRTPEARQERPAKTPKAPRPVREPRPPRDWKKLLSRAGLKAALRTAVVHHPLLTAARPVPPVLAKDWAAAVAAADARAVARARAAAPAIKVTGPDRPALGVAADGVVKVAPLVESALHTGALHTEALQKQAAHKDASHNEAPRTEAPTPGDAGSKGAPVRSALALSAQPPRPSRKPAGHMAVLDTGSMVSLAQHEDVRVRS